MNLPSRRTPPPRGASAAPARTLSLLAAAALAALLPGPAPAAELVVDFSRFNPGPPPAQFRPALTGGGPPPEWRILAVDTPSALPALPGQAPPTTHETVLGQLSQDRTDERFPLLVYEPQVFSDFTATLRFRTVSGRTEQMAGLAFRLLDEKNYYVIRVSSLGNNLRFYKFVDGVRSEPVGPSLKIPAGEWHALKVVCKGNAIRCLLDDQEVIPTLTDQSFLRGKFAFWTKSDAVSHFARLEVDYEMVQTLPQRLVDVAKEKYPRLLSIVVFARDQGVVRAVAASDPADLGTPGTASEEKTLTEGLIFAGRASDHAAAVFPMRDRNGDPLFAVKYRMRTFSGQTEANAVARAKLMNDELEKVVRAAEAGDAGASLDPAPTASGAPGARKN